MSEDRMEELFRGTVAGVEPEDRLGEIRARAGRARRRRRTGAAVVLAAAAVVAVVGTVSVLDDRSPGTDPAPPVAVDPSGSAGDGPQQEVTAYFLAEAGDGPRLFGERRSVPADDAPLAALELLTGRAGDPDYRSVWPTGSFAAVAGDAAGGFEVTLSDAAPTDLPDGLTDREAEMAVLAVVHTLRSLPDGARAPVRLSSPTVLGADTALVTGRAEPLDDLGLVNVLSPAEGATVSGTLRASGLASSPEANVPWRLLGPDGEPVREGFATAEGWLDALHPWQADVDLTGLAPGTYVLEASTDTLGDGEGTGPTTDTRSVVVE